MERRDFITAALALAFMPASAKAQQGSRLRELARQMRERYGADAEEILQTANDVCREVVSENPELDPSDDDDVERLTDLAMDRCLAQLRAEGLWND